MSTIETHFEQPAHKLWQLIWTQSNLRLVPDEEFEQMERRGYTIVLSSFMAPDRAYARVAIVERAPLLAPIVRFL